jgi:protein arginine kinase activator
LSGPARRRYDDVVTPKKMKCDGCNGKPVVTEVIVKNGQKIEQHLCEKCAAEAGIAPQVHAPFNQLFTNLVISQGVGAEPESAPAAEAACEGCGMTFAEFRKAGALGCSRCYAAFEPQLGPLIERAHEGATHHIGKVPRRSGVGCDRQRRLEALRKELAGAVEAERFERAARLRDEIRREEAAGAVAGDASATPPQEARD